MLLCLRTAGLSQMAERGEEQGKVYDGTVCLYKLGSEKACHRWSFFFKREECHECLQSFKKFLISDHGLFEVAKQHGLLNSTITITVHRNLKEPQFPNGRVFACNTQQERTCSTDPCGETFLISS